MISMGVVWDRTVAFLSTHLGGVLPIVLLTIFAPTMILGNFAELREGAGTELRLGLGAAELVLSLVSFWGQLAITAQVTSRVPPGHALGVAGQRLLPAIGVMIVLLIAALLVFLVPLWAIMAASGVDMMALGWQEASQVDLPAAAVLPLLLYMLIALPLFLWLAARLAVTIPAVVAERRALAAIARSFWLTRGSALKIIGVVLLYGIVASVASFAVQGVFGSVFHLLIDDGSAGISLATVLTAIVRAAVGTAFTVLATVFAAELFLALLARREAAAAA